MTVYAYSRVPAFNPNTNPASVAKSATGSVYDIGDTGFLTPLNLTLVATNTVTTTLVSDSLGMFPDFTLVDRTQCVFKSGTFPFILTTTTPIPGPTGAASTVPGPPGPATTDASLFTAGTVADARLPTRLLDAQLSATYPTYPAMSPTGLYASRPAAATVKTGSYYHATDVQETYRATGPAGGSATSWVAVNGAGAELGYAERITAWDNTSATVGAWTDVPGLSITVTVGERPIVLDMTAYTLSDVTGDVNVSIFEGATEIVRSLHRAAATSDYATAIVKRRLNPSPGIHTYKVSVYKTLGQIVTLVGGIAGPVANLQARNA